jgi:hypothetical protein
MISVYQVHQADGMSVLQFTLCVKVNTKLKIISMNSFRFQQLEIFQRRSLAPVR